MSDCIFVPLEVYFLLEVLLGLFCAYKIWNVVVGKRYLCKVCWNNIKKILQNVSGQIKKISCVKNIFKLKAFSSVFRLTLVNVSPAFTGAVDEYGMKRSKCLYHHFVTNLPQLLRRSPCQLPSRLACFLSALGYLCCDHGNWHLQYQVI